MRVPTVVVLLVAAVAAPAAAQTDTTQFDRLWGREYDGPRRIELALQMQGQRNRHPLSPNRR